MIPFIPDTPITMAWPIALLVTSMIVLRFSPGLWIVLAVPWLNWIATRLITMTDGPAYAAALTDIASGAALIALWHWRTMAVLPLAGLYALMVFSYGFNDLGWIGRETMWAFTDVAGYIQLVLLLGMSWGTGLRVRRGSVDCGRAGGDGAMARAVARRLPPS